jgi:hypothetical protein
VLKDSDEYKVLSLDSEFKILYLETGSSADDLDATVGKYVWRNRCVCVCVFSSALVYCVPKIWYEVCKLDVQVRIHSGCEAESCSKRA